MTTNPTSTAARFGLNAEKLEGSSIFALNHPYSNAVYQYKQALRSLLPASQKDGIGVPSARLNKALLTVTNTLATGFEYTQDIKAERALIVSPPNSNLEYPTVEQVAEIIRVWARHWTNQIQSDSRFRNRDGDGRQRRSAAREFQNALGDTPSLDWVPVPLSELIDNLPSTSFKAIPSLLAAILHGQSSQIDGHEITWRRIISDGGEASVQTQPFSAPGTDGQGYFSYVVAISLETQAGRHEPWVYLKPSVRRYADLSVSETNFDRNVAVLVAANRARMDNHPFDSTLVRLSAEVPDHNDPSTALWDDALADVLGMLGARQLRAACDVLVEAPRDRAPAVGEDEYYVVHAEGIKYGEDSANDELQPGLQFIDVVHIINSVLSLLPCLKPDQSLVRDDPFNLLNSGRSLPEASRTIGEVRNVAHSRDPIVYEERAPEREQTREEIVASLRGVAGGQSLHVTVITHRDAAREAVQLGFQQLFYLEDDEPLPDIIDLEYITLGPNDQHLVQALDRQSTNPRTNRSEFEQRMRHAFQEKMEAWEAYLKANVQRYQDAWNLVLIEMPQYRVSGQHPKQGIKGAVREACDRLHLHSQMFVGAHIKWHQRRGRLEPTFNTTQAIYDLLFRQPGVLFDQPKNWFAAAGIPEDVATNLQVLAIDLNFSYKPSLTYPTAVLLNAEGRFEVVAPGTPLEFEQLRLAGPEIGRAFGGERINLLRPRKDHENILQFDHRGLMDFLQSLVLELQKPTIILINAANWARHNRWRQLRNPNLRNCLDILDFSNTLNEEGLKLQRNDPRVSNIIGVVRLRSQGETPYYVTSGKTWNQMIPDRAGRELQDYLHLTGFTDPHCTVPHYYSVGRLSITNKEQNKGVNAFATMISGEAGKLAVKHAQMVEMVPFFIRADFADKWKEICRVPHLMRVSPAWDHANITNPLVMHLATKLVEDRLCILGET